MRIAANKAYCRVCRTALLTRKSLIPMRTSAKSVPRKKRTAQKAYRGDPEYLAQLHTPENLEPQDVKRKYLQFSHR